MDRETAERLGLPYDPILDDTQEAISSTAQAPLSSIGAGDSASLQKIRERVLRTLDESDAESRGYQDTLNRIEEAKQRLLQTPDKREMLQGLVGKLTATRSPDDPRFFERQNLYTFMRDVGEYGQEQKAAEKEREAKRIMLQEMQAKYGMELAEKRRGRAEQLAVQYLSKEPTERAPPTDEITRIQQNRNNLIEQRSALDPRDPNYLALSRSIQELDKRIAYLGGERAEKEGDALTVGQKALDKKIGEEYANWVVGGGAVQSASRISRINDITSKLKKNKDISGPVVGFTLDNLPTMASVLYPDAQDAKDVVESVVQTDLRAILGGQFAQKEGEALIKRAYNPRLGEEKNAKRLQLLALQMQMVNDEKNRAMQYFGDKGTIQGYTFRPFTANDFLTSDQLDRLDAGETPEQILGLAKPAPKPSGEGKPAGGKPNDPKKKYKKKIKVGDRFIEVEVEE
jgi:hypothetical protein